MVTDAMTLASAGHPPAPSQYDIELRPATSARAIVMVVCSVAGPGLVAIPAGLARHQYVLPRMAAAAGTDLPASFLNVYRGGELASLLSAEVARFCARPPTSIPTDLAVRPYSSPRALPITCLARYCRSTWAGWAADATPSPPWPSPCCPRVSELR